MDTGATNKTKLIGRRVFFLSVAKLVVFTGIIVRLVDLQIAQKTKYKYLSEQNRFREWKLVPQRGIIEDFYGKKLADNSQVFQLHLIPEDVKNESLFFFRLKNLVMQRMKILIQNYVW